MIREKWVFGLVGGMALALSLSTTPARAQATNVSTPCVTTDLTGTVISSGPPCANVPTVYLTSGTQTTCAHGVVIGTERGNAVAHVVGHGFAVDANSNQYVYVVDATAGLHVDAGETADVTAVASAVLISQGSAPNEAVDVILHAVFDTKGNLLSVQVDKLLLRCPG